MHYIGLSIYNKAMVKHYSVGSSEMQITLLTSKIKKVSNHLLSNPKDLHSRRGLVMMSNRRRTMLKYLKGNDIASYGLITSELNIKKI